MDGSPQARAALRWAAEYAAQVGSSVWAVAAWQPPESGWGDDTPPVVLEGDFEHDAARWLHDAVATVPGPAPAGTVVEGDPAHVLLDTAETAALLVLGNHGRGALSEVLLGSVARRCVRHARCPVLLVPAAEDGPPNGGSRGA
ncbi:universal stress protein [Pseudonocardia ammonioxydans]|uniref:universal stress protein n=1 Tax=Pseudonocardia ammonioxydans TaxID=260086 RepID=UPI001FEB2242|nr:universal stress protein [Pseudonocardia ammonioxydans]